MSDSEPFNASDAPVCHHCGADIEGKPVYAPDDICMTDDGVRELVESFVDHLGGEWSLSRSTERIVA